MVIEALRRAIARDRFHMRLLVRAPIVRSAVHTEASDSNAMKSQESDLTRTPLASRVATGADAAQVADALVATWQDIEAALVPIIGSKGVAALYKRSLHLASPAHPWLAALRDGDPTSLDLAALKSVVGQQDGALAALGGNALLQTFYQLLGSLVGPSLTERLLRSVWADTPGRTPAQDTKR